MRLLSLPSTAPTSPARRKRLVYCNVLLKFTHLTNTAVTYLDACEWETTGSRACSLDERTGGRPKNSPQPYCNPMKHPVTILVSGCRIHRSVGQIQNSKVVIVFPNRHFDRPNLRAGFSYRAFDRQRDWALCPGQHATSCGTPVIAPALNPCSVSNRGP